MNNLLAALLENHDSEEDNSIVSHNSDKTVLNKLFGDDSSNRSTSVSGPPLIGTERNERQSSIASTILSYTNNILYTRHNSQATQATKSTKSTKSSKSSNSTNSKLNNGDNSIQTQTHPIKL